MTPSTHLGSFAVSLQLLHHLRVDLEELLEHGAVVLPHELLAGQLHALLQAPHVLQHTVQGDCRGGGGKEQCQGQGRLGELPWQGCSPP